MEYRPAERQTQPPFPATGTGRPAEPSPIYRWASVALVSAGSFLAVELAVIGFLWLRLRLDLATGFSWILYALIAALLLGGTFSLAGTAYLEFYIAGRMRLKDLPVRERQIETVQVREEVPAGERLELMAYELALQHYLEGEKVDRREVTGPGARWTQAQFGRVHAVLAAIGLRSDRLWLEDLPATHELSKALVMDPTPEQLRRAADTLESLHRIHRTHISPEGDYARIPTEAGSRRIELK